MVMIIARKFLRTIGLLIGVALITFLLIHLIPGNPWNNYKGSVSSLQNTSMDPITQKELSRRFGLDLPLWRQFTRYMLGEINPDGSFDCGALCGNLGPSIQQYGRDVKNILFIAPEGKTPWESRFGYSLRLFGLSVLITIGLGLPIGISLAARPQSKISHAVNLLLSALISIPNFILGLLTIVGLASWLKLIKVLPDWNQPSSWIIPALVLAVIPMAGLARVTRTSLLNVMHEDYIRTARAKGLTDSQVLVNHVLRSVLASVLNSLGPALMEVFTGLLVIENLYAFPGLGRDYWSAVLALDYPLILALTLIYASAMLLINLLLTLAGETMDPRLRKESTKRASL